MSDRKRERLKRKLQRMTPAQRAEMTRKHFEDLNTALTLLGLSFARLAEQFRRFDWSALKADPLGS